MSVILAGIVGVIAREIIQYLGGMLQAFLKKNAEDAASDSKIDQHAKDVANEMEQAHDQSKMDQADRDILSGR